MRGISSSDSESEEASGDEASACDDDGVALEETGGEDSGDFVDLEGVVDG